MVLSIKTIPQPSAQHCELGQGANSIITGQQLSDMNKIIFATTFDIRLNMEYIYIYLHNIDTIMTV